jgi:hypothetical protein
MIVLAVKNSCGDFELREKATGRLLYMLGPDLPLMFLTLLVQKQGNLLRLNVTIDYHPKYGQCREGFLWPAGAIEPADWYVDLLRVGDLRVRRSQNRAWRSEWNGQAFADEREETAAAVAHDLEMNWNLLFHVGEASFYRARKLIIDARLAYEQELASRSAV